MMSSVPSVKMMSSTGSLAGSAQLEVQQTIDHTTQVPCLPRCFVTVLPPDDAPRVWTSSSTGAIIIRNSYTCEVLSKIENVFPSCMAVCSSKVWVGRNNGKINIYDLSGNFLTVLQNSTDTMPISSMVVHGDRVWTVASSKDIVEWDALRFSVTRIYFGPQPGDLVQTLAHNSSAGPSFLLYSGSRGYIRVWNSDGKWTASVEGGCRSLVSLPAENQLWAAGEGGVVVYTTNHPTEALSPIKTLQQGQCVLQLLFVPVGNRVWAINDQQICTVYNTSTFAPIQTFTTPSPLSGLNAFISHKKEIAKVWFVNDDGSKISVWDAVSNSPTDPTVASDKRAVDASPVDDLEAAKNEITYLKKKIKYIQSVGTIYRQRIGILFREKFRQRDYGAASADLGEFDTVYKQALADLSGAGPDVSNPDIMASPKSAADTSLEKVICEKEALQLALNEALAASGKGGQGVDVEKVTKYWKDKFKLAQDEMAQVKQENERMATMLHEMGPQRDIDIKRAHHICQVLKEKNALKEREQALLNEVERLKKKLSTSEESYIELKNNLGDYFWNNVQQGGGGAHDPADREEQMRQLFELEQTDAAAAKEKQYSIVVDQMREDNEKLKQDLVEAQRQLMRLEDEANECQVIQKQNAMLKARIQKMKQMMHSQRMDTTNAQTEMQTNIEVLMANLSQLQTELGSKDATIQELSTDKLKLMQDISRMHNILEKYKTKVLNLEREQISRSKAEQIADQEHRKETSTLCNSLDAREGKIQQLQANFIDISEQLQHQIQQVSRTNHELDLLSRENMTLKAKLQQLDMLLDERRQFSALLSEVQGRMEMAIEELKRAQSTSELAAEMANLEQRIAGLTALEAQLKQKDDLIAVRDDEVQKLKLKLAMFERNINNISAVFLQFPHSLEEMETMIIENEEYKKMAGQNAELEERVKLRQLEMKVRRQQQQQQGVVKALHGGVLGSLDAATAALLARTAEDSDSDDESVAANQPSKPLPQTPTASHPMGYHATPPTQPMPSYMQITPAQPMPSYSGSSPSHPGPPSMGLGDVSPGSYKLHHSLAA